MKAFVIERRIGEYRDAHGWIPTAATEDGDEARRLADLWSKPPNEPLFRATRYSETTKTRAPNGVWLVVLPGGRIMWAHDEAEARATAAQMPTARAAAFEPSIT